MSIQLTYTQAKQLIAKGYDLDTVLVELNDQPSFIEEELSIADIQAIIQGGCASGAYMPAVTYYQALHTMARYGDVVVDFYGHHDMCSFEIDGSDTWGGFCVSLLSGAVELWCSQFANILEGVDWA